MKKQLLTLFTLFWMAVVAIAQPARQLDQWLQKNVSKMGGRALLAVTDKQGNLVYERSVNRMSLRNRVITKALLRQMHEPFEPGAYTLTSRQPIASASKWLSAALVMTFVDEGLLAESDTVGRYLPILSQHGKGHITIAQCLSHTTGIKTPNLRESLREVQKTQSMEEAIEQIAKMPMDGQPGTVFRYSNAGLQIAAAVIEQISGKDFETLFQERIAGPLSMNNTDFRLTKVPLPAGGARSTTADYLHFLQMLLNKGVYNNKRILSERSITAMHTNRLTPDITIAFTPDDAGGAGYGYGAWILDVKNDGNIISSPGLFGAFPFINTKKEYVGFLMTLNLNSRERTQHYVDLKKMIDELLQ